MLPPPVPLRTYLFAPAHDEVRCREALLSGADAVLFDLEDLVPDDSKAAARARLDSLLDTDDATVRERHIRVNNGPSGFDADDIAAAVRPGVTALRLPKVEDAGALERCADVVRDRAALAGMSEDAVRLYVTIESGAGVFAAARGELGTDRVTQLVFATGDLRSDIGYLDRVADGEPTLVSRSMLVMASSAMGLGPPVDGVYGERADLDGLRRATAWAAGLGYFGKSVVSPEQVPVVHDVLTPDAELVARARVIDEEGSPHPSLEVWARRILRLAAEYASWDSDARDR